MDLRKINLVLANVTKIRSGSSSGRRYNPLPEELNGVTRVETNVEKEITDDGEQGAEGLKYETYQLPFDDLFLRLEIRTDSYGYNERVETIQFAKATEKMVIQYVPV